MAALKSCWHPMYYFCTYFDQGYLARGLALYESLREHCSSFELWILCMDRECHEYLKRAQLPGVNLISLAEFERDDEKLLAAKQNRKPIEYYFTCTPSLPLFILKRDPQVDVITYLDADLYFFASPESLYKELGEKSVAITEHRFADDISHKRRYGIYNVGYMSFRRDGVGLACLNWWRDRCLEWCYDRVEDERFADQKYLDKWPEMWPTVVIFQNKGANLAPWNLANCKITTKRKQVMVDGQPLVFFHFHALVRLGNWLFEPNLFRYKVRPTRVVLRHIYKPYIRTITRIERQLQAQGQRVSPGAVRSFDKSSPATETQTPPKSARVTGQIRWIVDTCRKVHERRYILVLGRRSI